MKRQYLVRFFTMAIIVMMLTCVASRAKGQAVFQATYGAATYSTPASSQPGVIYAPCQPFPANSASQPLQKPESTRQRSTLTPLMAPRQAGDALTFHALVSSSQNVDRREKVCLFSTDGTFTPISTTEIECGYGATFTESRLYSWANSFVYIPPFTYFDKLYVYDTNQGYTQIKQQNYINQGSLRLISYAMTYDGANLYGAHWKTSTQAQLKRFDPETLKVTVIGDIPEIFAGMGIDSRGQMFAIGKSGILYKVDKRTAACTKIGETGLENNYIGSATIDPNTDEMYWQMSPESGASYLYKVNLTTAQATLVYTFEDRDRLTALTIPYYAVAGAPAKPQNLSVVTDNGSLNAKVKFDIPSIDAKGVAEVGAVEYTITASNGLELARGTAAFGQSVTTDITVPEDNNYQIVIRLRNSKGASETASTTAYIGFDQPTAPEISGNYSDGAIHVSWTKPETGVNGGYIDVANLTFTVTRFPGEVVVASDTTSLSLTDHLDPNDNNSNYYYTVIANNHGQKSESGKSKNIQTKGITPTWNFTFDEPISSFTIIDLDNDSKTWSSVRTVIGGLIDEKCITCHTNKGKMNDWIITPAFQFAKGQTYRLSFDTWIFDESEEPATLSVCMGASATAEAMTIQLMEDIVLDRSLRRDGKRVIVDQWIEAPEDGLYYIGFHAKGSTRFTTNDGDIYIDNISVDRGLSVEAPDTISNLIMKSNLQNGPATNVTFTTPNKNIKGTALSSLSKIEVIRDGSLVKTFENPAIGGTLTFNDPLDAEGWYHYTIIPYNEHGDGKTMSDSIFVGVNVPESVSDVTIAETEPGTVKMTWSPVTTDSEGNPIDASFVRYRIVNLSGATMADSISGTEYTFEFPTHYQQFVAYGVVAYTTRGKASATMAPTICVGTPETLPYLQTFANNELSTALYVQSYGSSWQLVNDGFGGTESPDGDGCYLGMQASSAAMWSQIETVKINLQGIANPVLSFYTYNFTSEEGTPNENEITVYVREVGAKDWTMIKNATVDDLCRHVKGAWGYVQIELGAYSSKNIQVAVRATAHTHTFTAIDHLKLAECWQKDLSVSLKSTDFVSPGDPFTIEARVANDGMEYASGYTVNFYRQGTLLKSTDGTTLRPGSVASFKLDDELNASMPDEVTYSVEVVYNADEETSNNRSECKIGLLHSDLACPTGLSVTDNGNERASLSWTAPTYTPGQPIQATETFENQVPWKLDGFGGWKVIDGDKHPMGGFDGVNMPGITIGQTRGAFFVADRTHDAVMAQAAQFEAHSGNRYMMTIYSYNRGNLDDWAISPRLSGRKQTISFWAKAVMQGYPEIVEVYYSTGGSDRTDFPLAKRLLVRQVESLEWTQISVELPEGANYFAIRSCGYPNCMLLVDDVAYEGTSLELNGYNLYRDGVCVNSQPLTDLKHTDLTAVPGYHEYCVTAVYQNGDRTVESRPSNRVGFTSSVETIAAGVNVGGLHGMISVQGAHNMPMTITTAAGTVVYKANVASDNETIPAAAGVYMVRIGTHTVKVLVK